MIAVMEKWGETDFKQRFRTYLCQLDASVFPLQQGLKLSSIALPDGIDVMVLSEAENSDAYLVKVGIFYKGVIAGCSCADDPTPVVEQTEYCEVMCSINKRDFTLETTLLPD